MRVRCSQAFRLLSLIDKMDFEAFQSLHIEFLFFALFSFPWRFRRLCTLSLSKSTMGNVARCTFKKSRFCSAKPDNLSGELEVFTCMLLKILTRSLVALEPPGLLWQTLAPKLLSDSTSASISEKVNISWGQRSVDASFTCVDLHDIVLVSRSINMLSVTDFVRKGIISGVRVQAGLHLDMLDADRSPAFLPELHRWISKLTARHLHACPPGDLLITMVKETVILYKKEFRKMKKSRISPWCERDENAKWLRDCLWLCQACERGFTCRPMWRNLRQEAHSYPQADICSAPLSRS